MRGCVQRAVPSARQINAYLPGARLGKARHDDAVVGATAHATTLVPTTAAAPATAPVTIPAAATAVLGDFATQPVSVKVVAVAAVHRVRRVYKKITGTKQNTFMKEQCIQ